MTIFHPAGRRSMATVVLAALAACSGAGNLGNILGGVLGGGAQPQQASGTIRGVDTRSQQISLQLSDGQSVALGYDNNTRVIYQNQNYPVTALEAGDQVTARVQSASNGGYYTDSVWVTQSVQSSGGATSGSNVQSLQGRVRQIDRTNGMFTLDTGNNVTLTVSMPYNASQTDINTFQSLRSGDAVRLYGVFLNNGRVELRRFY